MAAYAALVSLMNTIHNIINHPHISTFFNTEHIRLLLEKVSLLLDFIEANNYHAGSKEAEDLEREIAFAAQEAEGVLDIHIMDRIHDESDEAIIRFPLELQQKTQDMDAVVKKANDFKGNQGSGEEEQEQEQPPPVMEIGETMVGLDAKLSQLLDELTGDPQSSRHTISIVGMGGTGKTTLAKNIFENKFIKEHFDFRAWATISHEHNAKNILSQLLYGPRKSSSGTDLGDQLHKTLFSRRYLIILDDIWSVKALDEVKHFFPDNNNGSRIVLTTRQSDVARDCGSTPLKMKFLDEDSSWKLFCLKAFKSEACPAELWEVGKLIVKSCKGLALSIVVMGGLLSKSSRAVEYWKGVAEDMKSLSEKQGCLDVLSLSYTLLPAHLKPCFLYMGTFEEDSEIIVSRVVKLWVGEGFIKPNGTQVLDEIGEGLLLELIDRNLIIVRRQRKNGKIASCGIHDLLRDLCIKLGKQNEFFHAPDDESDLVGTERRVVCWSLNNRYYKIPLARSIRTEFFSGELVKRGLLKVFAIDSELESPPELDGNVNLRYLAYYKDSWDLPYLAHFMWNLQTLIIKNQYLTDSLVAPSAIWKMRQLRHVECKKNIYIPQCKRRARMENLQTLKTVRNFKLSMEVCKNIPNIKKLYLRYDDKFRGYNDCWVEYLCNLALLSKLESLKLEWNPNLTISASKLTFPSSLNKLSLKKCGLHWDDLEMIGSLPQLEVLILRHDSVMEGEEWSPIDGQFLRLKFLQIERCPLEYWDADSSHFPVLEKLVLILMDDLEEIPLEIGEIPTLELIRVEDCSESSAISAIKIKKEQDEAGNDAIQIQVSIYDEIDMEDFKKMVDSEGLSHVNVHLEISSFLD